MRTGFSPLQLADPHLAEAAKAVRACVHCGICTATCPTYVLLGDERDGPRGRIAMMQAMLEKGGAPAPETVLHVDRCLSCLACRTACPSGVDYARLVDHARVHIERHFRRPPGERLMRWAIARLLTRPAVVSLGLVLARWAAPLGALLPGRLGTAVRSGAHAARFARDARPAPALPEGMGRRIALMPGCVQRALAPGIDQAVARVLARRGFALIALDGAGCCGALPRHLGRAEDAKGWARRAIAAFEKSGCEAVLITATGCSAHLKDLGDLFLGEAVWEKRARAFSDAARDFLDLASPRSATPPRPLRVAYHEACSQRNALNVAGMGEALLQAAGFELLAIPEGHLCCGSAGSYSLLEPEIAGHLRARKLANVAQTGADVLASGNIGCLQHLAGERPALHVAELLDWAEGGPSPFL